MAARLVGDPWALLIGAASGATAWSIGTRPVAAVGLAVVVMTVKVIAGRLIPPEPRTKPTPPDRSPSSPAQVFVFRRDGDHWTIGSGGATCPLPDQRGLAYLHVLVSGPGHAFPVGELNEIVPRSRRGDETEDDADYRQRRERLVHAIADVELEREEAEEGGDHQRAAEIEREIKAKKKDVVRLDVTTGIAAAIERIAERQPTMGDHLRSSVQHTEASFYSYVPDPARTPAWEL